MTRATMDQLRDRVRGQLIAPEDDSYEEARRVYYAMIDRRPRAILRAAGVVVTRTVRDLLLGSRIELEDRGSHTLKGVPGEWELFAVSSAG